MRFYFCEGCGKRVTENDLRAGEAFDKDLKGIYCKACGAGVKTQRDLNLSDPKPETAPQSGVPAHPPSPPSTRILISKLRDHSARRLDDADKRSSAKKDAKDAAPSPALIYGGAAAGVLVILGLVVAISVSGRSAPASPKSERARQPDPPPPVRREPPPVHQPRSTPAEAPPTPVRKTEEELAKEAFFKMERFEGIGKEDYAAQMASVDGFLREYGNSIVAGRARRLRNKLSASLAEQGAAAAATPDDQSDATQPVAAPQNPAVHSAPVEPAPVEAARRKPEPDPAFEAALARLALLDDLLRMLQAGETENAAKRLAQANADPALAAVPELAAGAKVLDWHAAARAAFDKGIEALAGVASFDLGNLNGKPIAVGKDEDFRFAGRKGETIYLRTGGLELPMHLQSLDAPVRARLIALGLPDDANGFLAQALTEIVALSQGADEKAAQQVEGTLTRAKAAGATESELAWLREFPALRRKGLAERQAETALAKFERHFAAGQWPEADAVGQLLQTRFEQTAAVRNAPKLADRVAQAVHHGAPIREYTLVFQDGQPIPELNIEAYDGSECAYAYGYPGHENFVRPRDANLRTSGRFASFLRFVLFRHEGGALPDDTQILEAKLVLTKCNHYPGYFPLDTLAAPWDEKTVTWNSAAKDRRWKAPGGDIRQAGVAAFMEKDHRQAPVPCEFDLSAALQESAKERVNHGWRLIAYRDRERSEGAGGSPGPIFASSRAERVELRPKLVLKVRCARLPGDTR